MGVQEVSWVKGGVARAGYYTFFYGKGNENYPLGACFYVHQRIVPAVKRIKFVSDKMSYLVRRGHWCNIFPNAHAPTLEKNIDSRNSFYGELE